MSDLRLSASVNFDNTNGVDNELLSIMIYKNGSEHRRVQNRRNVAAGAQSTAISVIVDNDGNDTFEVYVNRSGAGNGGMTGAAISTWFCGEMI